MLYRIDYEKFLNHAIDHFTFNDLCKNFQYLIISSTIAFKSKIMNCEKANLLYPTYDACVDYISTQNIDVFRKMYLAELSENRIYIYKAIIMPLLSNHNLVIVCNVDENQYIDVLVEYIMSEYKMPCIDLNVLFSKESLAEIHFDKVDVRNAVVPIRREAAMKSYNDNKQTVNGRLALLNMMSYKEKRKLMKSLNIEYDRYSKEEINEILLEYWVNGEDD